MARRRAGQQLTDNDVVRGGPIPEGSDPSGQAPPNDDTPPAPKMVKVKVGELEVEVPEEAANAIEGERTAARDAIRAREELLTAAARTPQQQTQQPQPSASGKDPEEELDELMYTNPREYRKRIQERITKDIEARYAADQTQRTFWDWFWQINTTLKRQEHDVIAEALFTRNLSQLQSIPLREAAAKLGQMVKDYLKTLTGAAPEPQPRQPRQPNRSSTLEGGPGPRTIPQAPAADGDEPSLGDLIKARQKRITGGGSRTTAS